MEAKVIEIISSILNIDESNVSLESSPEDLHSWDSLNHMNIIVALEEEFETFFSEDEIIEMLTIKSILVVLNGRV